MAFWKKKGPTIGEEDENPAAQEFEEVEKKSVSGQFGGKIDVELAKIHGKLDSMNEIRKATTERFAVLNEQLGELRGMMNDITKQFSKVEVESTKAVDKVNSVQPEIFMTELRKDEGKVDALKANLESNESLMRDVLKEVKEMRHKMDIYKGTEQILNLHEEIKVELAGIKKVEANIERHANRVETIFLDVEKKFSEFDKFDSTVKDLSRRFQKIQSDFDKIRIKTDTKADKKEFVDLLNKFNDFEKHTGNIIKLLDERSKHIKDDIKISFNRIKEQLESKHEMKLSLDVDESKVTANDKKELFGFFKKKKKSSEEKDEEKDSDVNESGNEEKSAD